MQRGFGQPQIRIVAFGGGAQQLAPGQQIVFINGQPRIVQAQPQPQPQIYVVGDGRESAPQSVDDRGGGHLQADAGDGHDGYVQQDEDDEGGDEHDGAEYAGYQPPVVFMSGAPFTAGFGGGGGGGGVEAAGAAGRGGRGGKETFGMQRPFAADGSGFNPAFLGSAMAFTQSTAESHARGERPGVWGMIKALSGSEERKRRLDAEPLPDFLTFLKFNHALLSIFYVREWDHYTTSKRLQCFVTITFFAMFMNTVFLSGFKDNEFVPHGVVYAVTLVSGLLSFGYGKAIGWSWENLSDENSLFGMVCIKILRGQLLAGVMYFIMALVISLAINHQSFGETILRLFLTKLQAWFIDVLVCTGKFFWTKRKKEKEALEAQAQRGRDANAAEAEAAAAAAPGGDAVEPESQTSAIDERPDASMRVPLVRAAQ